VAAKIGCQAARVLVDKSAEKIDPFDRSGRVDRPADRSRHPQADPAVRPCLVVVPDVDLQDMLKVSAVEDQDPVPTLLPDGAYPAFGISVRDRPGHRRVPELEPFTLPALDICCRLPLARVTRRGCPVGSLGVSTVDPGGPV
jgi:hypothetical protein